MSQRTYKDNICEENGKFFGKVTVKGRQRQFLCHGARTKDDARAIVDAEKYLLRQQIAKLVPESEKPLTFSFMINNYLEYVKKNKSCDANDKNYCKKLSKFFEGKLVKDLKRKDIENFRESLRNGKRKNATINRHMEALRKAFNLLIEEDLIQYNPCKGLRPLVENNRRNDYLVEDSEDDFLNALPYPQRDIVEFAILTGLRQGNVFNLNKSQVSLQRMQIEIQKADNKGRKEIRIPLMGRLKEIVLKYYDESEHFLFVNPLTGYPYTDIRKTFNKAKEAVGLPDLVFHDLRRTTGTKLLKKGTNLRVIRDVLSHSSVTTTERYLCVDDEDIYNAYALLSS